MQQTIQLRRSAQRAFTVRAWWNAKSGSFSAMAGEEFTNGQVVMAHVILVLLMVAAVAAVNLSFSLAFLLLACAAWAVYGLNRMEKGGKA